MQSLTIISFGIRGISTCCIRLRNHKGWDEMQKKMKIRKDKNWKKIETANPFTTNIGIRNQLFGLGLRDPNDSSLVSTLDYREIGNEMPDKLIEAYDHTEKAKYELYGKHSKDPDISKDALRRILTKKNFFPDPPDPNLLTWIEKETMRALYRSDPNEWNPQRLSECFPVTPKVALKIAKKHSKILPRLIKDHDSEVRDNWRKISKGQLQLNPELQRHLAENSDRIENGIRSFITDSAYNELMSNIVKNYEEQFLPLQRSKKGEFGLIIQNYRNKIKQIQAKQEGDPSKTDLVEKEITSSNLLLEDPFLPNMPNPFSGTAMMNVGLDLSRERSMTMAQFRQKFLDKGKSQKSKKKIFDSPAQEYLKWIQAENEKDNMAKSRPVEKLSPSDIERELAESQRNRETFFKLQKPKSIPETKTSQPQVNIQADDPIKVDIPAHLRKPGAIFKMENSYYDSNGEFLFRVTNPQ